MNGVEILSKEDIVIDTVLNTGVFCKAFVLSFVIMCLICFIMKYAYKLKWGVFVAITIFLGTLIGLNSGLYFGEVVYGVPNEYKTIYKATLSNEVDMNKFLESYKIVSKDGKIFTIVEKSE